MSRRPFQSSEEDTTGASQKRRYTKNDYFVVMVSDALAPRLPQQRADALVQRVLIGHKRLEGAKVHQRIQADVARGQA